VTAHSLPLNVVAPDASMPPAVARAAFVELGVRLENSTGQAATALDQAPQAIGAVTSSSTSSGAGGSGLGQSGLAGAGGLFDPADLADDRRFAPQIVRGLNAMVNQRGGSMSLRLDPPELGELRVHMNIARGTVTADFTAATQQAQSLLDRHMTALRQSLESHGLTVERLTVHVAPSTAQQHALDREDSGPGQQNGSWSSQHDAGGSESRGRREHDDSRRWVETDKRFSLDESLLGRDAGHALDPRDEESPRMPASGYAASK
jgi:flagellar hook-length control protein FliK